MACVRVDCQQRACMVCGRGRCTESASCRAAPVPVAYVIGSAGKLRHPARSAPGARRARTPRSGPRARRLPEARLRGVWGVRRVESAPCRGGRSCGLQAPRPWVTLLRVGTRGRQRPRAHQRSWHHRGSLGAAARDGCARSAPFARVGAREALRAEDAGRPGSGARIRSPYVSEDRRGRYIIPLGQERPKGPIGRQRGVRALPARKPQVVMRCAGMPVR